MGSRKTPGSEALSPFAHTSPAVPDVITSDNGAGGSSVSVLQGEFVISSPLKNDSSLLFSAFHSSTAMTLFRTRLEQDMVIFSFFFCKCSFYSLNGLYCLYTARGILPTIMCCTAAAIFKWYTDG